jgi:hypothetical protein
LPNDLNAGEIKKRWGGLLTGGVIQIEDSEVVEQTSRRYSFGDVVADRRYRAKLVDICNALELHSGEPDGADPTSPRAERRPGNEMT